MKIMATKYQEIVCI